MTRPLLKSHILHCLEDETTLGFNEIRLGAQYAVLYEEEPEWLQTVELFCFGQYEDYAKQPGQFIDLSKYALLKLRKLTLASECLKQNRLTYKHLQEKLNIHSIPSLEMFLAEAIYTKVIDAVVFSEEQVVRVKSSIGRDVLLPSESIDQYPTTSVKDLIQGLKQFRERIGKGLSYVDQISQDLNQPEVSVTQEQEPSSSTQDSTQEPGTRKRKMDAPK